MDIKDILSKLQEEGPRRFARWDSDFFARECASAFYILHWSIRGEPDEEAVTEAFGRLLMEAVGAGHISPETSSGGSSPAARHENFLSRCFLWVLPRGLKRVEAGQRVQAMAEAWNLCEGLLGEPAWVNRYIVSRSEEITSPAGLRDYLIEVLAPVLTPPEPATWSGPFGVQSMNTREVLDDFLPGDFYAVAPRVVCVKDRRQEGVEVALFLQHGGQSRFMGLTGGLAPWSERAEVPPVEVTPQKVRAGALEVELTSVTHPRGHIALASGFVVVSALDSQRVWVLESP